MKSLADWLAWLEQLHPSAIDMGLDRLRAVADHLGLGRPATRVITVTGTNGKGSTCAFLVSLLRSQGLRVGLYSSPHLLAYNERVQLPDGQASDAQLCEAFAAVEAARGETSLTYFEMGTLACFWLFERARLDFAVLEVGLGGRLDAVNLIDPDISVVTSIGIDHVEWLGNSRDSVAVEKAGIFRAGRPVVCGDLDPPATLLQRAQELGCPLSLRGRDFDLAIGESLWHWRGGCSLHALELHELPLLDLPMENAAVALQVLACLDLPWCAEDIGEALQQTRLSGRFERRQLQWQGRRIHLILDVGHNPHAASWLAERLARSTLPSARRHAVFGLLADKELEGVLEPLLPHVGEWAVATLDSPRARPAAQLQAALGARDARVSAHATLADALQARCAAAVDGDEILVFGSFFAVAEALQWLAVSVRG